MNYKNLSNVSKDIEEGSIIITFQTNLPSNVDKDKQIAELHNMGVLSLETALSLMESVDDVEEELKRIQEEKPSLDDLEVSYGQTRA
jgi:hypothetical protein